MIGEELVFFAFLYIKLFELGVEVAFNNQSAVTHHKVNLLKSPLRSSSFERTDDTFSKHAMLGSSLLQNLTNTVSKVSKHAMLVP